MSDLLNFLKDPEARRLMVQDLLDSANRGLVANTLGGPVDAALGAANLGIAGAGYLGHKSGLLSEPLPLIDPHEAFGSSEWIGQQMQQRGMVSGNRNPVAEVGFSMLAPAALGGAKKVGKALYQGEVNSANAPRTGPISRQRGVINFDPSMSRPEKSAAVKSMAEDATARLRRLGFDVDLQHSGSAMGPSSYLRVFDPKTGRFIKDPLRISDHSKGPFNSQFVNDASGQDDIDAFIAAAERMRAKGPSETMLAQMANNQNQSAKMAAKFGPVRDRAVKKIQDGEPLSNNEKKALSWFEKNPAHAE